YKRGDAPDVPEGAHLPERAQVCAQVLLLREHGYKCEHGEVYFARSRRRVTLVIDEALEATTREAARRAKALVAAGTLPPPLPASPRCVGCSLVGICLPDETNLLRGVEAKEAEPLSMESTEPMAQFWPRDEAEEDRDASGVTLRRLQPARD